MTALPSYAPADAADAATSAQPSAPATSSAGTITDSASSSVAPGSTYTTTTTTLQSGTMPIDSTISPIATAPGDDDWEPETLATFDVDVSRLPMWNGHSGTAILSTVDGVAAGVDQLADIFDTSEQIFLTQFVAHGDQAIITVQIGDWENGEQRVAIGTLNGE